MDRMAQVLVDLHTATKRQFPLVLAGGYGLYVKQQRLQGSEERTLFPREEWPVARTTEDIDLLLRAEIATDSSRMGELREALNALGFVPIETAKYYQFVRDEGPGVIKIDLLAGPLGEHESRVRPDPRRVRPKPSVSLHARRTPEALGVEEETVPIMIGEDRDVEVRLPNALTFCLMKLGALNDRSDDEEKSFGRHHALDLYRCIAMLTPSEDEAAARIRTKHTDHPSLRVGRDRVESLFGSVESVGRLRLLEHVLLPDGADVDRFVEELGQLIMGDTREKR